MKKTSYIILACIGAWILIVTIGCVIISVNGRPYDSSDANRVKVMSGATTVVGLEPFDKVEFRSTVSLSLSDKDDYFQGVEFRQSDSCSVEYAECWGDSFTYVIEDSTLVITLTKPEDMKDSEWYVAGDPIIVRCPTITSITTNEYSDMTVKNFDIPSLIASAPTINLTDCRIDYFELSTDDTSSTIKLRESTVVENVNLSIRSTVMLYSYEDGRCGTVNVRSTNGISQLNIADLAYDKINVENSDTDQVDVNTARPYTILPAETKAE